MIAIHRRALLARAGGAIAALVAGKAQSQTGAKTPEMPAASSLPQCSVAAHSQGKASPQRAVSLRRLLESNPPPNAGLPGLTRLDGYVQTLDDLILWGQSEQGRPDLFLGDFLVALRAFEYSQHKKQPYPLISIDPNSEYLSEANGSASPAIGSNAAARATARRHYDRLCARPQTVRVEGMPRNTRIAKVLVDADYRMKMIAQGLAKLPLNPPIVGDYDSYMAEARARQLEEMRTGKVGVNAASVKTRYWFHPGTFNYETHERTIYLDQAQILLSSEDQVSGTDTASGKIDIHAQNFVCAWSARMNEIAASEPIWRDMQDVFRHFAIARVHAKETYSNLGADLRKRVMAFQPEEVAVPDTLPGIARWEMLDLQATRGRSRIDGLLHLRVCGGVSLQFGESISRRTIGRNVSSATAGLDYTIMRARPSPEAVSWSVGELQQPPESGYSTYAVQSEAERQARTPKFFGSDFPGKSLAPFLLAPIAIGAFALAKWGLSIGAPPDGRS